jgi:hypothetical protein
MHRKCVQGIYDLREYELRPGHASLSRLVDALAKGCDIFACSIRLELLLSFHRKTGTAFPMLSTSMSPQSLAITPMPPLFSEPLQSNLQRCHQSVRFTKIPACGSISHCWHKCTKGPEQIAFFSSHTDGRTQVDTQVKR